ncbi:alpha/beta hydrolase family esterase [Streptomyces monticola]|uniref:Alpha/beta hydrolase family esterase n=1 Tax=Streptomyces monticola TaxID=2666263 RepID=A0ABW2JNU3_9ACTN
MTSAPSPPKPASSPPPPGPTLAAARRALGLRPWWRALAVGIVLAVGPAACSVPDAPEEAAAGSTPEDGRTPEAGGPKRNAPTAPAAPTRRELRVDGVERSYLLHRPRAAGTKRMPLVVAFHGRGADAAGLRAMSRLDSAARARGMVVAFPEGLHSGWGAGTAKTRGRPDPDADVRFTEALVADLVRTERADPDRVHVTGFSNGGSMALRVAAQRPGLVAGAAAVSGQLPGGAAEVNPTGPVPTLIIYGADDPVRPLEGLATPAPAPEGQEPVTPTRSARASAEAFAAAAGARRPTLRAEAGYDRTTWRNGTDLAAELLVVRGAGHTWPGSSVPARPGFGRTSTALDATATVLDFLAPRSHR